MAPGHPSHRTSPDARKHERLAVFTFEEVRLLLPVFLAPLVEAFRRDDTVTIGKNGFEETFAQAIGAGVQQRGGASCHPSQARQSQSGPCGSPVLRLVRPARPVRIRSGRLGCIRN